MKPKRLSSFLYALMQESPVFLPMAISVTISAKPNVIARIM